MTYSDKVSGDVQGKEVTLETMDDCNCNSEINTVCLTDWSQ